MKLNIFWITVILLKTSVSVFQDESIKMDPQRTKTSKTKCLMAKRTRKILRFSSLPFQLDQNDPSEKQRHRLPSQINKAATIEHQHFKMLDDIKNQKDSSVLESPIPAGPNGLSRKPLGMVYRANIP
ncbi:hypothetical protein L3Y34_010562 [Caenorhabditis briggsae]|uniref:Uncharacterized protein n=1 Tax=Caenorhabditis briggsae TaxID=6238 RepID=A0AAE8ZK54_CAEBR|nr:hypothetical protein L3Y34_010562 [Caenorhabditis briggsae]